MPEWELHNKWAERMGISSEVADYVNSLIDFPEKSSEYMDFWMKHFTDSDTKNKFYKQLTNRDELTDVDPLLAELFKGNPQIHGVFEAGCSLVKLGSEDHRLLHRMNFLQHDGSRNNPLEAYLQLKLLRSKGNEYVNSWYLHHFLDYIYELLKGGMLGGHDSSLSPEEVLERLKRRLIYSPGLDTVRSFIRNHWTELLRDLGQLRI